MEWNIYLLILFLLGGLFFASAIYALFWAAKNGQFKNFEQGAKTIFSEEEPEGVQTDFFPGETKTKEEEIKKQRRDPENS